MNYSETLDYLYSALPMYHRIGAAAYKADISATVTLMQALGNPEQQLPHVIHVAGTNGKGSVSHMMASVLQQAGYKVGLYTSPHLVDFRERIRINGQMVPRNIISDFVNQNKWLLDSGQFSFFEMTVGIAFQWFVQQKVDVAVVEVGMGGRLDSTNVLPHPDLSIITNIGLDHTQFLGNTLSEIAMEKAGIIKDNVPVVIGETQSETTPVFLHVAERHHAPITFADQHYQLVDRTTDDPEDEGYLCFDVLRDGQPYASDLLSPLSGSYQLHNIATLFQALECLQRQRYYARITSQHIRRGIDRVVMDTGLHGRWEIVDHDPLTICETAHNAPGIEAMLHKLSTLHYNHLHIVYGCVNDKDYATILKMLPADATYYLTQPSVPRALPVADLSAGAASILPNLNPVLFPHVKEAIAAARAAANPSDLVLVTGSIFLVADALAE